MKNLYSSLFAGAAVLVATSLNAQSLGTGKAAAAQRTPYLMAPGVPAHHVTAGAARGTNPVNDECSTVADQPLASGGSISLSGDNTGATETNDFEAGSGLEGFGPVVWHKFTTSGCNDITVAYCGTASVFQNVAAFLARTCPATDADYVLYSTGNFTDCADGNATIVFNGVPAGTYYLPVLADEAAPAVGPYSIEVSAQACPAAPGNDNCESAISLTADTWCNFSYHSGFGGTQSLPGISCNNFTGNANDDVWFSFVATAADMTVGVQGVDDGDGDNNTGYDAVIEVLSGACPGANLTCADGTLGSEPEEAILTGLTVGSTYYVRVYDYYAGYWPDHSFGICVVAGGGGINIGITENASSNNWSVFPNPGTGVFTLQYSGANAAADIEVFDLTGRAVYTSRTAVANGTNHTMDLTGLSAGNYNVRLTVNGVRTEQRLMVK